MAQRIEVTLVDDIDGGEASETVTFAVDGTTYEIDLNDANLMRFEQAVGPWVSKARKVKGAKATASSAPRQRGSGERREHLAQVRRWAHENGHSVPMRGRVPGHIMDAYDRAHAG